MATKKTVVKKKSTDPSRKRVLILTGAGFTASPDTFGMSTYYITNEIRNLDVDGIKISGLTPGDFIAKVLERYYAKYSDYKGNELRYVNFETILNTLEELYTFVLPLKSMMDHQFDGMNSDSLNEIGMKPLIYELRSDLQYPLWEAISDYNKAGRRTRRKFDVIEGLRPFIKSIYLTYVEFIAAKLHIKSKKKHVTPLKDFAKFITKYIPNKTNYKRIYTLNYDYWLPLNVAGYYDGFYNDSFNLKLKRKDFDRNCHLNLHGAANWKIDPKTDKPVKKVGKVDYDDLNLPSQYLMSKDPLIISPIISGFNKSSRISFSPFLEIYNSFALDTQTADLIILIGYGFGDIHINNLLIAADCKIVIVDKKNSVGEIEAHMDLLNKRIFKGKTNFNIKKKNKGVYVSDNYKISFNGLDADCYDYLKSQL